LAHDGLPSGIAKVNGVDIYYEIEGEGMPILLMHGGLGADHWLFHWQGGIPPLADSYKLIYYDHRANGRSGGDPNTATFENLAKDAEALRQFLGLGKVVVLGHSYGGWIAQRYVLDYPKSVAALILYATAPSFKNAGAGNLPPDLANRNCPDKNYFFSEEMCIKFQSSNQEISKNVVYASGFELGSLDYTPRLNEISVPTLILDGKYDFVFPLSDQEKMRDNIKNSRLVIFEKSGHMANVEEPEAFQNTIREFLSEALGSATSVSPHNSTASTWGSIKSIK
jgi:proline iminopeptidase